jgi:hypothetical protein
MRAHVDALGDLVEGREAAERYADAEDERHEQT